MKLGSETGSVMNNIMSRQVIGEPMPTVGMGCTLLSWTDRSPGTINEVAVLESKRYSIAIEVTEDDYKVVEGSTQDGSAGYEYTPKPEGHKKMYYKDRATELWVRMEKSEKGNWVKASGGQGIRIGSRERYYDPSF